jgi:hypothetical protein
MTLDDFNRLPHFEQEIITHEEAVFMDMSRKHGDYHVFLYSPDDFYIEAYLFPETSKVAKYEGISDAGKYLDGIDISGVY